MYRDLVKQGVSNEIWDAVRSAIWGGVSFDEFIQMTKEAWVQALHDEIQAVQSKEVKRG